MSNSKLCKLPCVLQCRDSCSPSDCIDNITEKKWETIKKKSSAWKGLNKFGNVHDEVNWDKGPKGLYMHETLMQSQKKRKQSDIQSQQNDLTDNAASLSEPECSASKYLRSATGLLHERDKCVLCTGGRSKKGDKNSTFLRLSTKQAWDKFRVCPMHIQDEAKRERLIRLISSIPDFKSAIALEIDYHRSCYQKDVLNPQLATKNKSKLQTIVSLREAQVIFFELVEQVVFSDHEFRTLQSLLRDYLGIISNYGHKSNVKSSYVKDILVKQFADRIAFYERPQRNLSDIVYDNTAAGSYVEAALLSLGISDEQLSKNVASRINKDVKSSEKLPWPPMIPDLEKTEEYNELLMKHITLLKNPNKKDVDDSPQVQALTSLLTYYITGDRTAFATNYSVWLHGLTKSREAVDVSHNDGLGVGYNDVMMLRDLWALNDLKQSLNVPAELAEGEPAIMIVDNDNFRMDTLTGKGPQANRTNTMFVQPESLNQPILAVDMPDKRSSTLSASLKELNQSLTEATPYKTTHKAEPPVRARPQGEPQLDTLKQRTRSVIHVLSRADDELNRPGVTEQKVPSFPGFQARMSEPVEKSTPIFHKTYPNNPNKSILNDCMDRLSKGIVEKNMPFALIVGDHPVYELMVQIKSENPQKYAKILPFIGPFHIQMSFIYCMYKRFQGSGLADVLVASGVVAEGSCDQALRGKHFNRGVRCLRLFYETLVHHALNHRLEGTTVSADVKATLKTLRESSDAHELREAYDDLENNQEVKNLVETLLRDSSDSDHASLYASFMEMVEILTQNIHALRTRNWEEFKSSLKLMRPWLKTYGNDKYGRTLPDFCAIIESLPEEQEAFLSRMFAQSITGNPYSCVALEIWIESTMNKGSKLKNGWIAILNNEKQLAANVLNANNVNRVRGVVLKHANQKKRNTKHADCSKSRMKADEKAVQDISDCFREFSCDPFDLSNTKLRSLQSGIPASEALIADFKSAKPEEEAWVADFTEQCIYSKQRSYYERIPRSKRLNFSTQELIIVGGLAAKLKANDMEKQGISDVVELLESAGTFELEDILQYRVTEENMALFNVNGSMRKGQKSKLMQNLTLNDKAEPNDYTALVDMGLIWRLATPSTEDREKQDGTVYTWGDYRTKVVTLVTARHQKATRIIPVNDSYKAAYSIKDSERLLRKASKPVRNEFMKTEKPFPSITEFHALLTKSENKVRLQKFLEEGFSEEAQSSEIEFIYTVVGEYATNLTRNAPEPDLLCLHAEADTALFTIYDNIRGAGYVKPIVIDSEDTDNYVQAAYVSNRRPGTMLVKRKKTYVDAQSLCKESEVDTIIQVHIIAGSDHTSAYNGISKKTVADRVSKSAEAKQLLASCGTSVQLTTNTKNDMTAFVMKYVYNDKISSTASEARAAKWRCQKRKNLSRMIPDEDSLLHHFKRVNYIVYLQKNFQMKEHPSPLLYGWHLNTEGLCVPVRSTVPALPRAMPALELSSESDNETCSDSNDDIDESCGSDSYLSDSDSD